MRKYLLAAVTAAAIASPAVARDGSPYVGVDIGALIAEDSRYDFTDVDGTLDDVAVLDYNRGIDVGLTGGYDLGMFRIEGELAYKRAGADEIRLNVGDSIPDAIVDTDGSTKVTSAMVNGLIDMGDENAFSGYLGGGIGLAKVKSNVSFSGAFPNVDETDFHFHDSDTAMAWQVIAGVRYAVSANMDVGFKYRYFNTREYSFHDNSIDATLSDKWRSHSFMLSLAYNFYSPPPPPPPAPPPPPPPPPPATQTCPDGSVILATEACPVPPPPPPPPPPAPERG